MRAAEEAGAGGGHLPDPPELRRLVGTQVLELHEDWQAAEKGYFNRGAEAGTESAA